LKLLTQIGIIFGICWISTCIERVLPFTLPASIIGMLLLLALLLARVIKTEHIREKSDYLLGNLPSSSSRPVSASSTMQMCYGRTCLPWWSSARSR